MFRPVFALVATLVALAGLSFATGAQAQICESMAKDQAYRSLLDPSPPAIEGATAYDYKVVGTRALRLYVFGAAKTSDRQAPRPAVVFLFGGGWIGGNVNQYVPQARYFAERGLVTVLADYRVYCRDHATIVDEMADVKASVRWVRAHAADLGVDPHRIAVSGQSSGGHLALTTALFSDLDPDANTSVSARPDLLVLFYPCVDITSPQDKVYSVYVAGSHGQDVSPLYHVTGGLPPTIIFHGDADPLYAGAKSYCEQARAAASACTFETFEGAPHGFFLAPDPKHDWYERGLQGMDRYLVDAGYLSPKP